MVKNWHCQHIIKYRHRYGEIEYTMDVIKHKKGLLMDIKENFFIYIYREVLTLVFWFIATGAPLAARRVRILLIN
jgi:membrane protein required for beta-lactamase induction